MPSVLCQVRSANVCSPEQVWERHWASCDIDREIAMCDKREIVAPILSHLRALHDPTIVDCGCGAGIWTAYFARCGYRNVIGVDNFAPAIRVLEDRGGRGVLGDVRHLPFADGSVDVCLSFGVVEHFPESPTECLREMARILVPGGYLFLTVPYYSWLRRLIAHPARRIYMRLKGISRRFFEYRFSDSEIVAFCRNSGFDVLSSITDDFLSKDMSLGLWLDIPLLRSGDPGELNRPGMILCKALRRISPWLISAGILVIARKRKPETLTSPSFCAAAETESASLPEKVKRVTL